MAGSAFGWAALTPIDKIRETLVLSLACLTPWAFGSVEAWAQLAIGLVIAVLAVLGAIAGLATRSWPRAFAMPGLALVALAALGAAQAVPMPLSVLRRVAPSAAAHLDLAPRSMVRTMGQDAPVAPPSATISGVPELTRLSAVRLIAVWALYQSVLGLGGGTGALRRLGLALAANGVAVATFAIMQAASWGGKIFWLRPSPMPQASAWSTGGPFVGHGPLAAYLNLGLGFALAALLVPSGRRQVRTWAAYAAGVLVAGVVASHSRSGIVAGTVAAACLVAALKPKGRRTLIGLVALVAIAAAMIAAVSESSPLQRILSITDPETYDPRLEIGRAALTTWRANPVFGTGLGTFATSAASQIDHDYGKVFMRAEDEYLDLLVEGGLVGLGLALAGLATLARRGWWAITSATAPRDRAMAVAGGFGLVALTFHSLGDFASHIPGVAIPATILAARLAGLGGDLTVRGPRLKALLAWSAVLLATFAALPSSWRLACAESYLLRAGIPLPGTSMPASTVEVAPIPVLERRRAALEHALAWRPNWAEGHMRLGLTQLALYRADSETRLLDAGVPPENAQAASDPLWLHAAAGPGDVTALLAFEPIPTRLVPATRSFLEARRCAPGMALPHAWLAGLEILTREREGVSVHATRALELAGGDGSVLNTAAKAAHRGGDDRLAARLWRRSLDVAPLSWPEVADEAGIALAPEVVLRDVLPHSGRLTLLFADRLYDNPEDEEVRAQFLEAVLGRLDGDGSSEPERLALAAQAHAGLGRHAEARDELEQALRLQPEQSAWRRQIVGWCIEAGDYSAARRHALLGLALNPKDGVLRQALDVATELSAHGSDRKVRMKGDEADEGGRGG